MNLATQIRELRDAGDSSEGGRAMSEGRVCIIKGCTQQAVYCVGHAHEEARFEQVKPLADALEEMLSVYEMLMPGIRHIAVQDYRLVNEAPIRARKALEAAGRNGK
jgi:hypothetical protein